MSTVYMCDNCGALFSVNQPGWTEVVLKGSDWQDKTFNNAHNHGAQTRHMGPCCSVRTNTPTPRLSIDATPESYLRDHTTIRDGEESL